MHMEFRIQKKTQDLCLIRSYLSQSVQVGISSSLLTRERVEATEKLVFGSRRLLEGLSYFSCGYILDTVISRCTKEATSARIEINGFNDVHIDTDVSFFDYTVFTLHAIHLSPFVSSALAYHKEIPPIASSPHPTRS